MAPNPLLNEFYQSLSGRYPRDGQDMSYSEWICENTTLRGKPFSFKAYEFQKQIADDMSQSLSVIKPSQTGMTEVQIRKFTAFLARNRGLSGIYTMPSEIMFKRLSKTRVKPLISSNRAFSAFSTDEKPVNSMDLYEINGSYAYFTGNTEGAATSIPADYLCHDELDLSDQTNIGLFQSRLQNSVWRLTHRFSTPTLPGFAIDASYSASDQHEYMCRCPACNHHQIPLFNTRFLSIPGYNGDGNLNEMSLDEYARIDLEGIQVICERCQRPLDVLNPELREWVARFPGRRGRGYRIRPLCNRALMPAYIINQLFEMRRLDNLKGWYNTVLGETYSDGSNQLTTEMIRQCMIGPNVLSVGRDTPIAVGIDVGATCYVILGIIDGAVVHPFRIELVPSKDIEKFVEQLCKDYNVVCGGMDRYPYTPTAENVFKVSGYKIAPIAYKVSPFVDVKKDEFDEISYVQVNRTSTIDRTVHLIRTRSIQIAGYTQYEEMLIEHLKDMVRVEAPERPATWEKVTGNDHLFHAMGYLQVSLKVKEILAPILNPVTKDNRSMIGLIGVKTNQRSSSDNLYKTSSSDGGMFQ